ncbi:MAG: mechanosensitive ion channel family protein [Candidatus Sumerlaeia bacterium]|nr:mechanosensitive ion channel family protein [Candidatus Sumerlaeia bacterium]
MATTTATLGASHTTGESVHYALGSALLGIPLERYILAFLAVLAGLVLRRVVLYIFERYGELQKPRWLRVNEHLVQNAAGPIGLTVVLLGVLAAVKVLGLPAGLEQFGSNLVYSTLVLAAAWLLFNLTDSLVGWLDSLAHRPESRLDEQLLPILRKSLKVFIVILAVLQVVDQMGGDVKGLIAGLGLGGLAVALAARDSIANVFGSVVILADRPFRVGDWIEAQGQGIEGVVEEIGFRSTRIRTFAKSVITVPNSVVANWAINNWSAMPRRRVQMTLGVAYETTPEQIERLVARLREMLQAHPQVDAGENLLVHFTDFGESSLQILVQYFTFATQRGPYLAVREEINLAILRLLDELGIEIAFPTRTVYHRQSAASEPSKN